MTSNRLVFALAAAAAATAASPALARPATPFAVTIAHADLDLSTAEGQAALRDRATDMAQRTCTPRRPYVTYTAKSTRDCRARFTTAVATRIAERSVRHTELSRR